MGAIASGGAVVVNDDVVRALGIPRVTIDRAIQRERVELDRRERLYRGERPFPETRGRYVILVDDGLATGATMRAAVAAMRQQQPSKVVVAVPVAPSDTIRLLAAEADQVFCPAVPEPFFGVGQWYDDFDQTSDEEIRQILEEAWRQHPQAQSKESP